MNFLAHLYLSGNNTKLLIGNFIADAVKGNKHQNYPKEIQNGIILHRHIDTFTDSHIIVKQSKRRLHKRYNHYSGVIIDVFYDHYLAKNWCEYSDIPLDIYAKKVYQTLNKNNHLLPERVQKFLPYMIEQNWLDSYQYKKGVEKVLNGINFRTKNISQMHLAIADLNEKYDEFENDFKEYFDLLIKFTNNKISIL